MKKYFFSIAAALLLYTVAVSQPFMGLSLTNRGGQLQLGILAGKIELTAAYKKALTRNDVPNILSITAGKQFLLTQNDADNYLVTARVGVANYRVKDFKPYDDDPTGVKGPDQLSETQPVYNIELGKDAYMGRMFIAASYCKIFYYGAGIMIFFKR